MVKLAVVGAGIGGCSAAYFAHKYLPGSKVTVYEKGKRVGGRIYTFNNKGTKIELGAEFFNSNNRIVSGLVKEMGLEAKKLEEANDIAVWNGNEIVFRSNHTMFYTMLKLLGKYKLSGPRLLLKIREVEGKVKQLYENKEPTEFSALFEKVGLDKWYKHSFDQILVESGIDRKYIDEMITPITRIIYSQNAELGGFAGVTSLLGISGEAIYSLKDGNDILPRRLVEASGASVELGTKVDNVERLPDGTFRLSMGGRSSVFDAVVVAAPLEGADISFEDIENQEKMQKREFQKIYIRLMKGTVNFEYFNLEPSSGLPSIILTSREADPITRFSISESTEDESWVAMTSTEHIGDEIVDELFKGDGQTVFDHSAYSAYPIFEPIESIPNTVLDKGLLYVNAIESAASSLESSTFAALNSIKAIKEQLKL